MPERYYDELLRYFHRAVKDKHEAQDVVQEVLERVLAKRQAASRSTTHVRCCIGSRTTVDNLLDKPA